MWLSHTHPSGGTRMTLRCAALPDRRYSASQALMQHGHGHATLFEQTGDGAGGSGDPSGPDPGESTCLAVLSRVVVCASSFCECARKRLRCSAHL